jgi:hypothetical protein
MMVSTRQQEMLKEALVLIQQAEQIVNRAALPALASGVRELTSGLSIALAGLNVIVRAG